MIEKLEKNFNIKFKNKDLLKNALTHKSLNKKKNNEKLEFLGDRVLGLVLSSKLFDLYPNVSEGELDKRFAKLVNRKTCSKVSWSIGLQNYILIGNNKKKISIDDEKILSDCCEALIGAIYLDKGFNFVKNYVLSIWKDFLEESNVTIRDPKTALQEYSLKRFKKLPIYNLISSTGPKHHPTYKISVSIQNSKNYIGQGKSKQLAQLNGADKLLKANNIK